MGCRLDSETITSERKPLAPQATSRREVVDPLDAPHLVVLVAESIRQQQRQGDEQSVESTDVGGVAQPKREPCEATGERGPEQGFLLFGRKGLHLGHPGFIGGHTCRSSASVLNIGVEKPQNAHSLPRKNETKGLSTSTSSSSSSHERSSKPVSNFSRSLADSIGSGTSLTASRNAMA